MKNFLLLIAISLTSCTPSAYKLAAEKEAERVNSENLALLEYSNKMIERIKFDLKNSDRPRNHIPSIQDPI